MTALIILAAGESSRMGEPKQNLIYQNKTLLQRAIEIGLVSDCKPVVLVLGANTDLINIEQFNPDLHTIYNSDWKEGMATSIRVGVSAIDKDESVSSIIIMLCDQPFITTALLNDLIGKSNNTKKPIIACSYKDTIDVPAFFDKSLFGELTSLTGSEGAKKVIMKHRNDAVIVPFEEGGIDIDTPGDYQKLLNSGN